jgi:TonB-dependent starch-binding outer membrane protein SusC
VRKFSLTTLVATVALLGAAGARAQTRVVTGRVYDAATQAGLSGAVVSMIGGTAAAQSDNEGRYRISLPQAEVTVIVRIVGYARTQARVPVDQTTLDIAMDREIIRLSEVVVSGAATMQERRNVSTAVSTVTAEEVSRTPAVSLDNALQGKIVGAMVNMNSGAPGGGGQISIRGVTSILGNGEPLYVVDGVAISNAAYSTGINSVTRASTAATAITTNQDNPINRLADINTNDIESVQVLKSAAASAIYGSKATNGVIIIQTKRGKIGTPRFSITQRLGTYDADRLVSSRRFTRATALSAVAAKDTALVNSLCNPNCPFYDYQGQLYGQNDLSYETLGTLSGGTETTRYYVSASHKYEGGTQINSNDKRQGVRVNLNHTFGSRWSGEVTAAIQRSLTNRGLSNNDNTNSSPLYGFAYTPAILDLARTDAAGNYPQNPFAGGGGANGSNPFQTLTYLKNQEDVWRQIASGLVRFTALSSGAHTVTLSAVGGFDRFDAEGQVYSPNFLQFESGDGLPGTAVQSEALSRQWNGSFNAVHTYAMGSGGMLSFLNTLTTSAGLQIEETSVNRFNVLARGLVPTVENIDQGQLTVVQNRQANRGQAYFVNEEVLALSERLSVSGRVRFERSSVNGDRETYYAWPAGAASFTFEEPFRFADQIKLRAAVGRSGNGPRYGDRDVVLSGLGLIDGRNAIGVPVTIGNPTIKPEEMLEQEYGTDMSFANNRVGLEFSYFDRTITDLLLTAPLAPTSGFSSQVINGGKMVTTGYEAALSVTPVHARDLNWTTRAQFFTYDTEVRELPVPDFVVASSGFGAQYGRSRIANGYKATLIWGNKFRPDSSVVDTVIGDANPDFQMQFGSDVTYRAFTLNVLVDWRKGGLVSNMTQSLFDEGLNSRDYDDPSPVPGVPLGEYRYEQWNLGRNAGVYIQDGSFVKLREVTLAYQVPPAMLGRLPLGARDLRLSLSARNLKTWSDYWSSDPEVNNFGNQNVTRFVDLAPYPPSRSFFFSVDVGF